MSEPKIVLLIFVSGKLVLTGAKVMNFVTRKNRTSKTLSGEFILS